MKKPRVICYLRTHRRVWGLTQTELADLIGLKSGTQVSRIELSKRTPDLGVALACQVVFGIPPCDMFPHLHTDIEERVMRTMYRLHQGLGNATTLTRLRKRELCTLALGRATGRPHALKGI